MAEIFTPQRINKDMKLNFAKFLTEAPLAAPAALPPAPGGLGAPPMGGIGGMPPAPMGGMGGLGMPSPPIGGMGGMPGQPIQQQQQGPKELKQTDVWGVLEELLGLSKQTSKKSKNNVNSPHKKKHLMS